MTELKVYKLRECPHETLMAISGNFPVIANCIRCGIHHHILTNSSYYEVKNGYEPAASAKEIVLGEWSGRPKVFTKPIDRLGWEYYKVKDADEPVTTKEEEVAVPRGDPNHPARGDTRLFKMCECACKKCRIATGIFNIPPHVFHICEVE